MPALKSISLVTLKTAGRPATLRLRVHPPGGKPYDVSVADTKCTIGSGSRSTVRLRTAGVQPLHCLIVNSPDAASVRRWSAGTQLNGADFDDAPLADGDRLQLGPVAIEVVSIGSAPVASPGAEQTTNRRPAERTAIAESSEAWAVGSADLALARESRTNSAAEVFVDTPHSGDDVSAGAEEVFRQLRAANETSRRRSRRLLAALREDRLQRRELELQVGELQQQRVETTQRADVVAEAEAPQSSELQSSELPSSELQSSELETAGFDGTPAMSMNADQIEAAAATEESDVAVAVMDDNRSNDPDGPTELDASERTATGASEPPAPVAKPDKETYSALLADRIDRIEQLERQLGLAEGTVDDETSGDESLDETPDVLLGDSPKETEPSDEPSDDAGATESTVPDATEAEAAIAPPEEGLDAALEADQESSIESRNVVEVEPHVDDEGVSLAPESPVDDAATTAGAAPHDSSTEQEPDELSPDAASFWGFGDKGCGVDAELLGPLALSRRSSQPAPKPVLDVPLPQPEVGVLPGDIHDNVLESTDGGIEEHSAASVTDGPILDAAQPATEESPEAPVSRDLPGAEAPEIPGLSDSAWAHLRELSIWKDDETKSDASEEPVGEPDIEAGIEASIEVSIEAEIAELPAAELASPIDDTSHAVEESEPFIDESSAVWQHPELGEVSDSEHVALETVDTDAVVVADEIHEPAHDDAPAPASIETHAHVEIETHFSADDIVRQPQVTPSEEPPTDDGPIATNPIRAIERPTHEEAEPSSAASPAPAPASFIDRYAHMFDEENENAQPSDGASDFDLDTPSLSNPACELEAPLPTGRDGNAGAGAGEEDSIDDYMAQLMQRIRGTSTGSEQAQATWTAPKTPDPVAAKAEPGTDASKRADSLEPSSDLPPITLEEMKRSGPRPEQGTDMGALRDLANQTARSAIGVHASRKHRENATSKLLVVGAAVASGSYLLATAPSLVSLQFGGACIAVIGSLYWGIVIMRSLSEYARVKAAAEKAATSRDPARPQLPIDGPIAPTPGRSG
jgi:hypothetical protein